ncbi:MAG: glucosamine-6-phosphate deaminase [Verrucomicrobia bacterium]|nr:glucosamine-6-phosphate deaminase [Verrucomicrobiota bacterium]
MQIVQFDSESAWADSLANRWGERLRATPSLRMCLPAGHTPVPVYAAMIAAVKRGEVSFRGCEVFTLDEFGELPPDDPGRCAQQLRRSLVDHVDLPPERFHFIRTEAEDLAEECRQYDIAIGRGFDLTLLGVGLNGHLGMNEPGTPADRTTHRAELHASTVAASRRYLTHAHAPTWGATVGLKHLLKSKEVWLLACGAGKAGIVQRTLRGEITPDVPASLLRQHPNSFLFVDSAAGAGV